MSSSNTPQLDYDPSLAGNAFFVAFFALAFAVHVGMMIPYKTWGFSSAMLGGLLLEVVGYVGRIKMHDDRTSHDAFIMYIVCLTIAGAFFAAAIYLTLSRIVVVFGEHISRIRPATYSILFICFDVFSLVLQAVGGGMASTGDTQHTIDIGKDLMVAGLAFQCFNLLVFIVLAGEFAFRAWKAKEYNPLAANLRSSFIFKAFLFSLALATLTLFIRSAFRVAELSQGYSGALANNQVSFMVLEPAMIAITTICLTVLHPGVAWQGKWAEGNFHLRRSRDAKGVAENKLPMTSPSGGSLTDRDLEHN